MPVSNRLWRGICFRNLQTRVWGVCATGLVMIFTSSLVGCASVISQVLEKPEVKFQGLSIREATTEGATAVIGLDVYNPNGVGLQLDEVQYRLELAGREVARAKMDRAVALEAKSTSRVEIPVPFLYNQVFQSILDLMQKGTAAYKVTGSARLGIFELPFENGGDVKLR